LPHKWDYPKWQKLFNNTTDLNQTHEEFYLEAGYKLIPINLMQNGQVILPKMFPAKDYLLKQMIIDKYVKQSQNTNNTSMLIVGFWTANFLFNIGLENFASIDGLECYQKAVDVAKRAQDTLPPELNRKFRFFLGSAENLDGYPCYDIIVNFCLEHVKNPALVMKEALQHLKPNGTAYFTPPIGHGCDSPTHLHHFQEPNLNALLPEGYTAK